MCHIGRTKKKQTNNILFLAKLFHTRKTTMHIHRLLIAFLPLFTSKLMMFWFRTTSSLFSQQNWMWTVDCGVRFSVITLKVNKQQPGKQRANSETLSKSLCGFPVSINVPCFRTFSLLQHIQRASENRQNPEQAKNNNVTMLQFSAQHLYQFLGKDIKRLSVPNICSRNNAWNIKIKRKLMFLNYYHLWQHFHIPWHIAKARSQTPCFQRNVPVQTEMADSSKLDLSAF